ncbi:MAG: transposase [Magnetococcales bacterium]|nr:transposase [Magnetococcales bacterium]
MAKDIRGRFDELCATKTCYPDLNEALKRLHRNKDELLLVLDKPWLPLHNNLSESDIREYVQKRKISGGTRSADGRRCRDTFASLKKTCRKHSISFWEFLKDRIGNLNRIPFLPDVIRNAACVA